METASFIGFIKVLFFIIMAYYLAKFLMRLLLPVLIKKVVSKAEENLRNHAGRSGHQPSASAQPRNIKPDPNKKVGEYVDYEEIE